MRGYISHAMQRHTPWTASQPHSATVECAVWLAVSDLFDGLVKGNAKKNTSEPRIGVSHSSLELQKSTTFIMATDFRFRELYSAIALKLPARKANWLTLRKGACHDSSGGLRS